MSSLKVNLYISFLIGINIPLEWLEEATLVNNYKVEGTMFKYLRMYVDCNHRREGAWKLVLDIVRGRLSSWNNNHLLIGGCIILLNSIMITLPVNYLSFFKVPTSIILKLESLFLKKLWGGGA